MIKAITGTRDILPSDIPKWKYLEKIVSEVFQNFNYKEIRTPVFEETALFARGIGEATDIVSKEMYTFIDRGGTSLTLKPEMTAGVVRAFIEHSLDKKLSVNKLYYISPMFRQERPQAGRFRQFHQFGAEALGSHDPMLDSEMIIMAYDIIAKLGLKNLVVKINSLGIPQSRENYKSVLKQYLEKHFNNLSQESRKRFETNILRIFDSKEEQDQKIMADAPLLINYLDDESLQHFEKVKNSLSAVGINYEVDPKLVRGLDYYSHTTFEIVSGSVGSQSSLCGGGRYDMLVKELGGGDMPGVGFAAGMERILLACENEKSLNLPEEKIDIYIVSLEKDLVEHAFKLAVDLRRLGLKVETDYQSRSVKAQMREANKYNSKFVLVIGGEEYKRDKVTIKDMVNEIEAVITISRISDFILTSKKDFMEIRKEDAILKKIESLPFLPLNYNGEKILLEDVITSQMKDSSEGIYLVYLDGNTPPIHIGSSKNVYPWVDKYINNQSSLLRKHIFKKNVNFNDIPNRISVKILLIQNAKRIQRLLQAYFNL